MKKEIHTLGCCGIDCGLCPRYYTQGSSKCPGCCGPDFDKLHPSCGFVTCCAKKHELEVCAECEEYPCARFDKETGETDSFVTHRNVRANQSFIIENGLETFLDLQRERISLLKTLLKSYDEGRSKSFYCLAATLLSIDSLKKAMQEAEQIDTVDSKARAKIMKEILNRFAQTEDVELKLRKAPKH